MKNIFIIVCLFALSTPVIEVITESNKNAPAIWVTGIVACIGLLGICMIIVMCPKKTTSIYVGC